MSGRACNFHGSSGLSRRTCRAGQDDSQPTRERCLDTLRCAADMTNARHGDQCGGQDDSQPTLPDVAPRCRYQGETWRTTPQRGGTPTNEHNFLTSASRPARPQRCCRSCLLLRHLYIYLFNSDDDWRHSGTPAHRSAGSFPPHLPRQSMDAGGDDAGIWNRFISEPTGTADRDGRDRWRRSVCLRLARPSSAR